MTPNDTACHKACYRPLETTLRPANAAGYIVAPWDVA